MACDCTAVGCDCVIIAGPGISVTGIGSSGSPFTISNTVPPLGIVDTPSLDLTRTNNNISGQVRLAPLLSVLDSPTVDLTLAGAGTEASPFVLSGGITGLDLSGPVGSVMTKQLDGSWKAGPATQAPIGSIVVGPGLRGDGSGAAPLRTFPGTYAEWEGLTL